MMAQVARTPDTERSSFYFHSPTVPFPMSSQDQDYLPTNYAAQNGYHDAANAVINDPGEFRDSDTQRYYDAPTAFQDSAPPPIRLADNAQYGNYDAYNEPTTHFDDTADIKAPVANAGFAGIGVPNGNETGETQQNNRFVEHFDEGVPHASGSNGWLPAVDVPHEGGVDQSNIDGVHKSHKKKRSSVHDNTLVESPVANGFAHNDAGSGGLGRTGSRRSAFKNSEGQPVEGPAFLYGAGTSGPQATVLPDESLHVRRTSADNALTPKQKSRIEKSEARDGKKLSKIIKEEAKVEKETLSLAITELGDAQKFQRASLKQEAKAHASHAKILTIAKKAETEYLAVKARHETLQAQLKAEADTLEAVRDGARQATERVQLKSQEVDSLRKMLSVDEREREVKLSELKGPNRRGSMWR